jgi:hypothetical protein
VYGLSSSQRLPLSLPPLSPFSRVAPRPSFVAARSPPGRASSPVPPGRALTLRSSPIGRSVTYMVHGTPAATAAGAYATSAATPIVYHRPTVSQCHRGVVR